MLAVGVRTSVAILKELFGWVDGKGSVCGVSVEWGGKAEEVGRVVEQDWGIDGGVGNVCLVSQGGAAASTYAQTAAPLPRCNWLCFFKLLCVP